MVDQQSPLHGKEFFQLDAFFNPPVEYRPVVFWSWNEVLQPDEIRRQARFMKDGGLGGGFIHVRTGLITEYLKEDWFKAVDAGIDESRKCGLKVYLYDEDKWPSGFAGGIVPLRDKNYRMKALMARPVGESAPEGAQAVGEPKNGIQVYRWVTPLGYDWFNGTCYSDLMNKEAMQCFIEESYNSYYKRYKELYGSDIVYEFTDEPCTLFRGRIPEGAIPFTSDLFEIFQKMHGYDAREHLHNLFLNEKGAERFRIDYFRTVNNLFENNFSKQIGDWCTNHNIGLTGHYMLEGSLYGQQTWGTKVMPNYRHQHAPGIDHLGRQTDELITAKQCQSVVNQYGKSRMLSELYGCSGYGMSFEDRLWIATQQIQLGVNLLNPHLTLYTMAGCRKRDFPPNLFYQQPWWKVNHALDIPLARFCYAMSKGTYHAEVLVIHPQESTFALWQTKYENCDNTLQGKDFLWDNQPTTDKAYEQITEIEDSMNDLILRLLDKQCHFDFGDETILAEDAEVVVKNQKALTRIGNMFYSVVVLPAMYTIAESTVSLLEEFKAKGGRIVAHQQVPKLMDGKRTSRLEKFLDDIEVYAQDTIAEKVRYSIDSVVIEYNREPIGHIWTHLRLMENGQAILLASNLNRSVDFEGSISLRGDWSGVRLLDHWTGQSKPVDFESKDGFIKMPLSLSATQSRLLLFDRTGKVVAEESLRENPVVSQVELPADSFQVTRLDNNALLLDTAYWAEEESNFSVKALPIVTIQQRLNDIKYRSKLSLKYVFQVHKFNRDRQVSLVLEHPEYYHIFVNGQQVKYACMEPWLDIRFMPIDITGKLQDGENTVLLECDNFQYGDLSSLEDNFARYGTEIEAIYIVGDFSIKGEFVTGQYDRTYWDKWNIKPDLKFLASGSSFLTDPETLKINSVTEEALPFYAGRVEYKTTLPTVELKDKNRLALRFEKLNAPCSEVLVDGKSVGFIISHPYRLDIAEYYKPGCLLQIVLYSTLRNLLGAHHNTEGETIFTSPLSFVPEFKTDEHCGEQALNWAKDLETPVNWQDDYCLLNFGDLGKISLCIF